MLGVSNSLIYQLTDYIGYDILLQYIQELIQQARAMISTGNYPQSTMDMIMENLNQASVQIAAFQSRVQVQQDALLVVDRQMSYMRQQVSARMMTRYQNNYHFGESVMLEIYAIAGGDWLRGNLNAIAAFMGTSTWSTIEKMCIAISVLIVAGNWVKTQRNGPYWLGLFPHLVSMLVVIRTLCRSSITVTLRRSMKSIMCLLVWRFRRR